MADIDDFNAEFRRFLKENFSREKQEAVFDFLKGEIMVLKSSKKLSAEDLNLVFAKLDILLK